MSPRREHGRQVMNQARIPGVRSQSWPLRLLRWIWTLPTNLIGHAAGFVLCRQRPRAWKSPAGAAWLYTLPETSRFASWGAVTLGHAVLASRSMIQGARGRWVLAHELAHARQHDWLGPAYLPLHLLCQAASAVFAWVRPRPGFTPWHAYNPLERTFLCVPYDVLVRSGASRAEDDPRVLEAFNINGLKDFHG